MNLTGKRFGRLTVLGPAAEPSMVLCRCDCGNMKAVKASSLTCTSKPTRSCGCLRSEAGRRNGTGSIRQNSANMLDLCRRYGTQPGRLINNKLSSRNRTGHTGVFLNEKTGKYIAFLCFQRRRHYLGSFRTYQEAVAAREEAERIYFAPVIAARKAELAQGS